MEYQTQEITLPGTHWNNNEKLTISAQIAGSSGLCYHAVGGNEEDGWVITHLESKKYLCKPIGTEFEVRLVIKRVVEITNWLQSEEELKKHPETGMQFLKLQQTVENELNMQLETAMQQCMPDYLVEDVLNEIEDDEYPIFRNALLYAFKIVPVG